MISGASYQPTFFCFSCTAYPHSESKKYSPDELKKIRERGETEPGPMLPN